MDLSHHLLVMLLACLGPSFFFLLYFYTRDRYEPEPPGYVMLAFALGTLAAPAALFAFDLLEHQPAYQGLAYVQERFNHERFLIALFLVGPVEELAKFIPLWAFLRVTRIVNEPIDALVYAAACALGFATVENWTFMVQAEEIIWSRGITLPFNHVLFSSFWGVALGLEWQQPKRGGRYVMMGLFLAIAFHGLYDYILFEPELPDYLVLPVVLVCWLWISLMTRKALRDSPFRF